jgi:chemotaxis signal transduction protein
LASHVGSAIHLVRATVNLNETAHFIIDDANLLLDPELISVSGLSDRSNAVTKPALTFDSGKPGDVVYERERYLLVEAGSKIGIRMTHIDGMRSLPKEAEITQTDSRHPGLMGLFLLDGEMIPLIRLAEHLGQPASPNPALERVFISSDNDRRVAFLVDSLTGIATSEWTTTQALGNTIKYDLASLRAYGVVEVRNIVDLRKVSRDIAERMVSV